MAIRSILAGVGAYLPERVVTNDELADGRYLGRVDPRAHRHPPAPYRGTARDRRLHGHRGGARRAGRCRRRTGRGGRDHPGHHHAGPGVPRHRAARAGGARRDPAASASTSPPPAPGFIYALSVADAMIRTGQARGVLVIGSEVYSRILNWQDRGTCVLFGDGAGAVFLRAGEGSGSDRPGILSTHLHAQGTLGDILYVDGAVGQPRQARPSGDERARGVPPRGDPARRGGGGGAGGQRADSSATSTGWCRTRPICASSTPWAASSACRRSGW